MHKGPRGTEAVESGHVVAIQDVRGLDKKQNGKGWSDEGVSYTVDTHATQGVAMCEIDTVGTLRAHHPGTAGTQSDTDHIVAFDTTQISSPHNYSNPQPGDPCHPLAAGAHPPAIAFSSNMSTPDCQTDGTTPTLKLGGHGGGNPPAVAYSIMPMNSGKDYKARETDVAQPLMAGGPVGGNQGGDFITVHTEPAIAWSEELTASVDVAGTIQRGGSGGRHDGVMEPTSTVRRLTPVECERLQGFPDNFTAIPWRKKGAEDCPDGPRYKALGNSMAVPVMRWIGERIRLIDDYISII